MYCDSPLRKGFLFTMVPTVLFGGTFTSFLKDWKSQNSRNQGFFLLCLLDVRIQIRIRINIDGSRSRRSQNIRIQIHNTVKFCRIQKRCSHLIAQYRASRSKVRKKLFDFKVADSQKTNADPALPNIFLSRLVLQINIWNRLRFLQIFTYF